MRQEISSGLTIWTSVGKIMYRLEGDTKAKTCFIVVSSSCVTEKKETYFILIILFNFCLIW